MAKWPQGDMTLAEAQRCWPDYVPGGEIADIPDLVKRLRETIPNVGKEHEAADALEAQAKEIEQLRDLVMRAAPTAWAHGTDIDGAVAWEKEAAAMIDGAAAIRARGDD
tara:strand:- start:135 stop:461 length:327 start_codon:yes stop_codon:yes gene_type:complete